MEIKKITKTVTKEATVKVYVAFDGAEFDYESDCRDYENNKKEEILSTIERCYAADGCQPFDGGMHGQRGFYRWYRPKNETEIDILKRLFKDRDNILTYNDIGEWCCVEFISMDDAKWWYTLSDSINHAVPLLEKLGYDVKITKKEETK